VGVLGGFLLPFCPLFSIIPGNVNRLYKEASKPTCKAHEVRPDLINRLPVSPEVPFMRKVLSAVSALMFTGLSATVISCGGAIVDDLVDTPAVSTFITTTTGPIGAAAAAYAVTKAAGEAASEAQVPNILVAVGGNGISGYVFDSNDGDWTGTGTNSETVTLTFYSTVYVDTGTQLYYDITDSTNLATGGSLESLLASNGGLETDSILMELDIHASRTFSSILVSTAVVDLVATDERIAFATGTTASYALTGEGYATLTSGNTISINTLTTTVTALGTSVTGDALLTIPMDDQTYTVTCGFDASGCTTGTVLDADSLSAGTISVSGTDIVYTDADGIDTIISW